MSLDEIDLIQNWGPGMENEDKVPSVISYSKSTAKRERQWGFDLSEDAISMVNTKMELEPQNVLSELSLVADALEGMHNLDFKQLKVVGPLPSYTTESAEEIVTSYLTKAFEHFSEADRDSDHGLGVIDDCKEFLPTDIVITVPSVSFQTLK